MPKHYLTPLERKLRELAEWIVNEAYDEALDSDETTNIANRFKLFLDEINGNMTPEEVENQVKRWENGKDIRF